jgi:hypothetical protein
MDILGPDGDRRRSARAAGLRSGFAVSHDGKTREACVVGNLSDTGALLMVERPQALDRQIILMIDGEDRRRPARIVWRTEAAVAVSFLGRDSDARDSDGWVFAPEQPSAGA